MLMLLPLCSLNLHRRMMQFIYLLNTQLVQDIIKNMYTHRNEKKDKTLYRMHAACEALHLL